MLSPSTFYESLKTFCNEYNLFKMSLLEAACVFIMVQIISYKLKPAIMQKEENCI